LPDIWETKVFHTDPAKADTDKDGFDDRQEIVSGYNPLKAGNKFLLKETDFDKDGLSDRLELLFGTDPMEPDTNHNGFKDGAEVWDGFSPTSTTPEALQKSIKIVLKGQRLEQRVDGIVIATYPVSTGKASTPTPVGEYKILQKTPKAWSSMAGLWMPYWMGFSGKGHGIHELPIWPGGYREGTWHLGIPVSHGCVRLGIGPAKKLYDWAPIGTPVTVAKL
jgi:lipoprotein-anchoring transpeptidase ErfK/SrfK